MLEEKRKKKNKFSKQTAEGNEIKMHLNRGKKALLMF